MSAAERRIAILGGGVTGLSAAYHLAQQQAGEIVLFEKDGTLGGMARSFLLGDVWTENFYHFICKPDQAYLNLIHELDLDSALRWQPTKMSYYTRGVLKQFGDPVSLLKFSPLSLNSRLQVAWAIINSKLRQDWRDLENASCVDWLKQLYGQEAYDLLWKRALELKFHQHMPVLSAAWIWTRTKRIAQSRRSLFHEELGYLLGGTRTLIDALAKAIESLGVQIRRSSPVRSLEAKSGLISKVISDQGAEMFDAVIAAIPQPVLATMLPLQTSHPYVNKINAIKYIAINCLMVQTLHPLTDNFWLNISDPDIPLAGLIEYTNLNRSYHPQGLSLWYIPEYVPLDHPRYARDAQDMMAEYAPILKAINPAFKRDWIVNMVQKRLQFAQPVCPVGFTRMLPDLQSPFPNLLSGDTCHFWPEDRTITDAIALGRRLAERYSTNHV